MAFADAILGTVAMPLYVFLSTGPTFWLWNYKEKLSLVISLSVVDASFSQGSLIAASRYSLWTMLRHILAAETQNYVN